MISQIGMKALIKNIFTLTIQSDHITLKKNTDITSLGSAFHRYLEMEKNRKPCGLVGQVNIISNFKKSQEFCKAMQADALTLLDDMQQESVISITEEKDAEQKKDLISRAIEEMGKYSYEHRMLFDLIITDVFIMPSHKARGGSTSAALGVIWANPKLVYPINDVVEFLVHEMTHHTMFMDELCHQHYDYDLILNKSNWACSAILNVQRPVDKVLHSIVVALEIFQFRCRFLGHPAMPRVHPPSECLFMQIKSSVNSIQEVVEREMLKGNALLKPRAIDILNNVKSQVDAIDAK